MISKPRFIGECKGSGKPGNQVDSKVPIFDRAPMLIYYKYEAVLCESPSAAITTRRPVQISIMTNEYKQNGGTDRTQERLHTT